MYCEKCSRIIEETRCPFCGSRKIREPQPKDLCFLTEQEFLPAGVLEDVLKQGGVVPGAALVERTGRHPVPAQGRPGRGPVHPRRPHARPRPLLRSL